MSDLLTMSKFFIKDQLKLIRLAGVMLPNIRQNVEDVMEW